MAIIQIDENWRVQSETHSWSLSKRQNKKDKTTGEVTEAWIAKSWHPDPKSAGEYWLKEQLRYADTHGYEQLETERDRLRSLLTKAGLHVQNQ